jgi:hypothetical protein
LDINPPPYLKAHKRYLILSLKAFKIHRFGNWEMGIENKVWNGGC